MIRTASTLALTSMLAVGAASAEGPEVSFSGYFLGGMGGGMDKDFNHIGSAINNEIDLATNLAFGPATTVDIYTTMNTGGFSGDWWTAVYFDGITFTHQFSDNFTFYGGDLIYSLGGFGYYVWKREASVVTEDAARGIGFSTSGLTFYTGSGVADVWKTFVSYEAPTPEGISLTLGGEYEGKVGPDEYQAGAAFGFEKDAFALSATAGVFKSSASDMGMAFLVEPFYDFGAFNVLASFWYQDVGDDAAPNPAADIEDMYFYIEPGFPINDIASLGVTFEYTEYDRDIDDDEVFSSWPTLYLAPTDDVLFLMTVGYIQPLADGADNSFGYGLELSGSF